MFGINGFHVSASGALQGHHGPLVYLVEMCDVAFSNNTAVICQNPKVTAINSCIEVDLTGQICADSIGTRIYSGK